MFYVQYDLSGAILATVSGAKEPPVVDGVTKWQLEFADWTSTEGKIVDPNALALVDAPATE